MYFLGPVNDAILYEINIFKKDKNVMHHNHFSNVNVTKMSYNCDSIPYFEMIDMLKLAVSTVIDLSPRVWKIVVFEIDIYCFSADRTISMNTIKYYGCPRVRIICHRGLV